jgi:hypothetical protein
VKQKSTAGSLYAVPRKEKKDRLRYNTGSKTVLSLPRAQADLLINQLNVPVTFLNPTARRQNPLPKFMYTVRKGIKRLICYILPGPKRILSAQQLSNSEQKFLVAFIRTLTRSGESMPSHLRSPVDRVVMVPGRGLFPSLLSRVKGKSQSSSRQMFIKRDHPLVQKAVRAVETDPRNVEMFIPLLVFCPRRGRP